MSNFYSRTYFADINTHNFQFAKVLGDVTASHILGLVLCLLVEMPTAQLQKLMVPQLDERRKKHLTEKSTIRTTDVNSVKVDEGTSNSRI